MVFERPKMRVALRADRYARRMVGSRAPVVRPPRPPWLRFPGRWFWLHAVARGCTRLHLVARTRPSGCSVPRLSGPRVIDCVLTGKASCSAGGSRPNRRGFVFPLTKVQRDATGCNRVRRGGFVPHVGACASPRIAIRGLAELWVRFARRILVIEPAVVMRERSLVIPRTWAQFPCCRVAPRGTSDLTERESTPHPLLPSRNADCHVMRRACILGRDRGAHDDHE